MILSIVSTAPTKYCPCMSCINCGSAFHEVWDCPKPKKKSTAARKDVHKALTTPDEVAQQDRATDSIEAMVAEGPEVAGSNPALTAGTQAPPVDIIKVEAATAHLAPKRGRPRIHPDRKAYKAEQERKRRAKLKGKPDA